MSNDVELMIEQLKKDNPKKMVKLCVFSYDLNREFSGEPLKAIMQRGLEWVNTYGPEAILEEDEDDELNIFEERIESDRQYEARIKTLAETKVKQIMMAEKTYDVEKQQYLKLKAKFEPDD